MFTYLGCSCSSHPSSRSVHDSSVGLPVHHSNIGTADLTITLPCTLASVPVDPLIPPKPPSILSIVLLPCSLTVTHLYRVSLDGFAAIGMMDCGISIDIA